MKVLVIISSHQINKNDFENIRVLNDFMLKTPNITFDYAGISSTDDFSNVEDIISFKYKSINSKFQFRKISDFISDNKENLDYDWYIKVRPDIKLLEAINFNNLSDIAINARTRKYRGPKRIKYGMSINGPGPYREIGDCSYEADENEIILDDQIFIFHKNVIDLGAFNKLEESLLENKWRGTSLWSFIYKDTDFWENEWLHTTIWKMRNIPLNVIGLNVLLTKYGCYSGDLNL